MLSLATIVVFASMGGTAPGWPTHRGHGARVVIDPGHDQNEMGAMSSSGAYEILFNDRLARAVIARLDPDPALRVILSRRAGEALNLADRAERINAARPDLVVSLHHDSVKKQFIDYRLEDGYILPTCHRFSGFSIFAQARGPHRARSLLLARAVADRYRNLGLSHTTYHAMKIRGENRRFIDAGRGIYAGDYLYLLRAVDAPVILLESGFIINPHEERRLADPAHVARLADAIAAAIRSLLVVGERNRVRIASR